jgi:hypothetical protein
MQKSKSVSELLAGSSKKLASLKRKSQERAVVLEQVCAVLPAKLAQAVVSAGIDQGRLTIGVTGAVWATRLRYLADDLQARVGESLGMEILRVRVRVVAPRAQI